MLSIRPNRLRWGPAALGAANARSHNLRALRFKRKDIMTVQTIAAAMQRVESVFQRRPEAGLLDDTPAMAHWESGTRVVSRHPNGTQLVTDMPSEIGGSGDQVTPGWLLRAALASCAATRIAMAAAVAGIELTTLDVAATSRSDARGLLGMANADGQPVPAEPRDVLLAVRIAAHGVAAERLRALVEQSHGYSPVTAAHQAAVPVALRIEVVAG